MTWPHAGRYESDAFTYPNGKPAEGATYTVLDADDDPIALWVDRDRSAPVDNPGTLGTLANLGFCAEPGTYTIVVDGLGDPYSAPITVDPDPEDLEGTGASGLGQTFQVLVPSTTWSAHCTLTSEPNIAVRDSAGEEFVPDTVTVTGSPGDWDITITMQNAQGGRIVAS